MHSSALIDADVSRMQRPDVQASLVTTLDELRRRHPHVYAGTAKQCAAKLMRFRARVLEKREAVDHRALEWSFYIEPWTR